MIRLATVFSGIGAIEHALDRMNLEHRIVFACDNGDIDIFTKEIKGNICAIDKELKSLNQLIRQIDVKNDDDKTYKDSLDNMLSAALYEYDSVLMVLNSIDSQVPFDSCYALLKAILSQNGIKESRRKEYSKFIDILTHELSDNNKVIFSFEYIVEIVNDFKKDNSLDTLVDGSIKYKSVDNIDWNYVNKELNKAYSVLENLNGKKLIKNIRDLSERAGMLHEKISSFRVLKELADINDYKEKKKYIDTLYKDKEKSNKVKQSYMANYDIDEDNFHWNVCFLDGNQYRGQVDLFVGGSPCQSFSLVGKQRGLEDTRGTLFYEYARLIKEIRPKVFIYENVKAILSNDEGRTWAKMQEVFDSLGYKVYYKIGDRPSVLNSKDYGIPQNRERMFVVGFRNDINLAVPFEFPEPVSLDKKMQDFLLDNVSGRYYLPKKGVNFVTSEKNLTKRYTQIDGDIALCQKKNQQFNWHGDFVFVEENKDMEKTMQDLEKYFLSEKVRMYVLASGTKNFYSKPKTDLEVARPLLTTMHKMHRAGVDNYVTTEGRLRKLTPRECLRLMGFCDSFKIVVNDTAAYQQAGNSIVVDVLIHIMRSILKSMPELLN